MTSFESIKESASGKFYKELVIKGKRFYTGCWDTKEEAARTSDKIIIQNGGILNKLFFPEEHTEINRTV
jgi:hypothetical protein